MRTKLPLAAAAVTIVMCGCVTGPYVRSDIFLDSRRVESVFVMPVTVEVTLDHRYKMDRMDLRAQLEVSRSKIKEVLRSELLRRGYSIAGFSKDFDELSEDTPHERALRESVQAYVRSAHPATAIHEDDSPHSLVSRTVEGRDSYPEATDTILYLFVKSHVADRRPFRRLTENSTIYMNLKLINLDEQKVVFSHSQDFTRRDVLHLKSLETSLGSVISEIPVKLD